MTTCESCRYYHTLPAPAQGGICRAHPPVAVVIPRYRPAFGTNVPALPNEVTTYWPPVSGDHDWCGAYTVRTVED